MATDFGYSPTPHIPTPSLNGSPTQIITARSSGTTSSSVDYSSPGEIAGLVWCGIIGTIVLVSFLSAFAPILIIPFILPYLIVKKLYNLTIGPPIRRRKERKRAAWTQRNNRATELAYRGFRRHEWAREELQLARKESRRPNLPLDWVVDLETGTRVLKAFRFQDLPAEIRLMIYSEFDYGTALNLMRVNRFFYFDKPANGIDREQRATYVYHTETFSQNKDRLACYGCLRIREKGDFEVMHRTGEFERFALSELERRCFDCRADKGEICWPRWKRLVRYIKSNTKGERKIKWRR
jgi:hypothetical protein